MFNFLTYFSIMNSKLLVNSIANHYVHDAKLCRFLSYIEWLSIDISLHFFIELTVIYEFSQSKKRI